MNNKTIGQAGEEIAQNYLKKMGYIILETNFRYSRMSEIDIIALKNDTVHFVEVKTRTKDIAGSPLEAVTDAKLKSICNCAKYYLSKTNKRYKNMQIDVIGIKLNANNTEIEFIENISLN